MLLKALRFSATVVCLALVFYAMAWLMGEPAPPIRADTVSLPYTFSAHTPARAAEVMANYNAIKDVVNGSLDNLNYKNGGMDASLKLQDASVTLAKMASDSVNSAKVVNDSLTSSDLGTGSVDSDEIAADAVGASELDDDSCVSFMAFSAISALDNTAESFCPWTTPAQGGSACLSSSPGNSGIETVVPSAIKVNTMYAQVEVAPSSGKSWDFTLQVDAVDTSVTCQIADTSTSCTYTGAAVSVAQGSLMELHVEPTGTPTSSQNSQVSLCWSPD